MKTEKSHSKKLVDLISEDGSNHQYPQYQKNNIKVHAHLNQNTVINLSSTYVLSGDAEKVLARGLNFAPTPRRMPVEDIVANIEDAVMRNRIPSRDAECLIQDVSTLIREISALRELRNNVDILVLPADKGNATVVVDTEAYVSKLTEMVSDTATYKK
ncbi:putative reverse transcriptase, partial [Operophtera brumata]